MTVLYGPNGDVILHARSAEKKPLVGELVTPWNGERYLDGGLLPSQLNLGFDSRKLTIPDFRLMREHHQVSMSLNLVSMMMYQRKWRLGGDRQKEVKHCTDNLKEIWPRLVRAMSKSLWAGYSPCALQWENDIVAGKLWLTKVKDLRPEECSVRWKEVRGVVERGKQGSWMPDVPGIGVKHKVDVFDGIHQRGYSDIPVTNSFWYPLLMEDGDFYGRKLLAAAFRPWYFSMIMHLYANRYMERFAEPTPVGRAPFDDTIKIGDKEYSGNKLMASLLQMQRNGSALILPNSRSVDAIKNDAVYDYTIEYIESQMRGAEFDRVIAMYDEEISLALFTPLLLMRNMDVGSSNLGVVHTQTWLTILNALSMDWEEYINRYILRPMAIHNFGPRAKIPWIEFEPLGRTDAETIRAILQSLLSANKIEFNLEQLSDACGLEVKKAVEITAEDEPVPGVVKRDPATGQVIDTKRTPSGDNRVGRPGKNTAPTGTAKVKAVAARIAARVHDQATRTFATGEFGSDWAPDLGFRKQFVDTLIELGVDDWDARGAYGAVQAGCESLAAEGKGAFPTPARFAYACEGMVMSIAEGMVDAAENAKSVALRV